MRIASKNCKWLGYAWINIALIFVLFNYALIWYFNGWAALQEIANPLNLWNFAAIVITMAPGVGLLALSDYLHRRA